MADASGPTRDLVGYADHPPGVVWPNGARVAISVVVNFEEGSELAVGDGDDRAEFGGADLSRGSAEPGKRDLALESMYEYGSRAGFWRLRSILNAHDVKCTFFACAVALERNPAAARAVVADGHEVCSHGYRWEDVTLLTREEEREHIRMAVDSITKTTGERPLGWYCRYGPSVNTRELIVEEGGFVYDSDAYNDDLPYWTVVNGTKHLVVPYTLDTNDFKFTRAGYAAQEFTEYLTYAFDRLYKEGKDAPKMMSIGLHLRLAGTPARAEAFDRFLHYVRSHADVWFARRIDIARWWQQNFS